MAILYVLCGIPGSGKSTWMSQHLENSIMDVSRDKIRFSLIDEKDEYFSKEKEVWKEFVHQINCFLDLGYNVMADATHINAGSRRKLLKEIENKKNIDIRAIFMDTPVSVCLERNALREGRTRVPDNVIKRMYSQFEEPSFKEGFSIIYRINYPDNKIEVRRKE